MINSIKNLLPRAAFFIVLLGGITFFEDAFHAALTGAVPVAVPIVKRHRTLSADGLKRKKRKIEELLVGERKISVNGFEEASELLSRLEGEAKKVKREASISSVIIEQSDFASCNFLHLRSINQDTLYRDVPADPRKKDKEERKEESAVPESTTCGFVAAYNTVVLNELLSREPTASYKEMCEAIMRGVCDQTPQKFIKDHAELLDESFPPAEKLSLYGGSNHPAEGIIEGRGIRSILINAKTNSPHIIICNGNYDFEETSSRSNPKITIFQAISVSDSERAIEHFNYNSTSSTHLMRLFKAVAHDSIPFFIFICSDMLPAQKHWVTAVIRKKSPCGELEVLLFEGKNEKGLIPKTFSEGADRKNIVSWLYHNYIRRLKSSEE